MNPLHLKTFPFFNFWQGQDILGIDLSDNILRIVILKSQAKRYEVYRVFVRQLPVNSRSEEISNLIRIALKEANFRGFNVSCVISGHQVITKNIEIPSINPREIQEIIGLQAGRHTPYSRSEIIVDYIDIGRYRNNYTKVLLVIASKQMVKRYWEILSNAGLKLERILFAPEGIVSLICGFLSELEQDKPLVILHIDESMTDFIVAFKKKAIFIRNIPLGVQNILEERQAAKEKFLEEVKNSLEAYQNEDIETTPQQVVLSGAIDSLAGLASSVSEALHIPVKNIDYLRGVLFSKNASTSITAARYVSLLGLFACLLAKETLRVNLIPEELRIKQAIEKKAKQLIRSGILVFTNLVLIFLFFLSKFYFDNEYLKKIDKIYLPLYEETKQLENSLRDIDILKGYLLKRGISLEVLIELYQLLGDDTLLSDIRYEEQGKITLRGTAQSRSAAIAFAESMAKSFYFKDVKTKYTTTRKEGTMDVADFEITASLREK